MLQTNPKILTEVTIHLCKCSKLCNTNVIYKLSNNSIKILLTTKAHLVATNMNME